MSGRQQVVSVLSLTASQMWLAEQVDICTTGVLRAVVTGTGSAT
ncbi:hypothetical protein [Plantactinospora endophytica]|nr:hypothetical protein [Plantactinospora endophytica]